MREGTDLTPGSSAVRDIYSVSRLNQEAKRLLETRFLRIWIEGEVSNVSRPASGHIYFCLKDPGAQIRCALFRLKAREVRCLPENGRSVLLYAQVSLYEGRGDFQLIVEEVEEAGEGALRRAFEALKARLAREGLFDGSRKRPLPRIPRRIGIITSPSGAAVRDILTTLRRRFPAIPVLIYPVPVQGAGAAPHIAMMIEYAAARGDCDVLILARGGGSLEDLWAFNEEEVARAIFACPLPIVTGIGHEIDFTIADLVADVRAPTPTAAAELLSPNGAEWLALFTQQDLRLTRSMYRELERKGQRVDLAALRLARPTGRLAALAARVVSLDLRLRRSVAERLARTQGQMSLLATRLESHSPARRLESVRLRFHGQPRRVTDAVWRAIEAKRDRCARLAGRLQILSPLATLGRGYSIIERERDGHVVRRPEDVADGEWVRARLSEGQLRCQAHGAVRKPVSGGAGDRTD
ncbi:MAG: exodeoxyribonuclease VII large subunit [Acidiferrobacteraceae bacterium]